jgi:hypothetical protein
MSVQKCRCDPSFYTPVRPRVCSVAIESSGYLLQLSVLAGKNGEQSSICR